MAVTPFELNSQSMPGCREGAISEEGIKVLIITSGMGAYDCMEGASGAQSQSSLLYLPALRCIADPL